MRGRLNHLMYIFLGFFGFQVPSANADAVLCFADPALEGESVFPGHEGCIDIMSWGWGVANSGQGSTANFSEVSVTKEMDKASPNLALAVTDTTKSVGSADLYQYRCSPSCPGDLLYQMTLADVFVTSLIEASDTATTPTESVTMNYSKITYCYTEADGKTTHCQGLTPPAP